MASITSTCSSFWSSSIFFPCSKLLPNAALYMISPVRFWNSSQTSISQVPWSSADLLHCFIIVSQLLENISIILCNWKIKEKGPLFTCMYVGKWFTNRLSVCGQKCAVKKIQWKPLCRHSVWFCLYFSALLCQSVGLFTSIMFPKLSLLPPQSK